MRRIANALACATCLMVCTLVLVTSGCSLSKKKAPASAVGYGAQDPYATTQAELDSSFPEASDPQKPATSNWGRTTDSYPSYGSTEPIRDAYDSATIAPSTLTASTSSRTHTVTKSDTLYALARSYYGDQRRWRDIYDANRASIADPNKIRVGQRLVIP